MTAVVASDVPDDYCPNSPDGRHKPFHKRLLVPVSWPIEYEARKQDDPNLPHPLRYWEIEACRLCLHEKATPHGFTPRPERTIRRPK